MEIHAQFDRSFTWPVGPIELFARLARVEVEPITGEANDLRDFNVTGWLSQLRAPDIRDKAGDEDRPVL